MTLPEARDAGAPPLVYVIVLNHDGREHLEYSLPSLAGTDYPNHQILVVDNGSRDDPAQRVKELCPSAKIIRNGSNLGWSGGSNVGIAAALKTEAQYVVLANNDIRVDPRWIQVAVDVAEREPRVGVIGFRVCEPEPDTSDRDAGFEQAKATWNGVELSYPRYVGGMAMFVRGDVFRQIGLIDEGFFAYGEENDFQTRARKAGYSIAAVNVPVWHYGQGSFGKDPFRAAVLQTRHSIRPLLKHETTAGLLHRGVRHTVRRVFRWAPIDRDSGVERRLQPGGLAVRIWVVLVSVAWNVWVLSGTIRRRRYDDRLSREARRNWERMEESSRS
jgi:GT2 family glycosyltransferase